MSKKSEEKTQETEKQKAVLEEKPVKEVKKEKKPKKLTEKEFEKKVLDLHKKGLTSEKIGEALRKEGIHPKEYDKKISKILKAHDSYEDPELKNIQGKLDKVEAHLKKNKQDKRAIREKSRIFSQRRKIKKYLKMPLKCLILRNIKI
jgi:ribosomal protein S15P/S13E